jgi:hypothetical protein
MTSLAQIATQSSPFISLVACEPLSVYLVSKGLMIENKEIGMVKIGFK